MRGIEGESETLGDWVSPIQWSDVKFGAHQEPVSTLGWRPLLTLYRHEERVGVRCGPPKITNEQ
jgi:hypothetical protein